MVLLIDKLLMNH